MRGGGWVGGGSVFLCRPYAENGLKRAAAKKTGMMSSKSLPNLISLSPKVFADRKKSFKSIYHIKHGSKSGRKWGGESFFALFGQQ